MGKKWKKKEELISLQYSKLLHTIRKLQKLTAGTVKSDAKRRNHKG